MILSIHPAKERTLKTGSVIFNSRNETYRINCSNLKTEFTSNHEEADASTVCYSSRFKKNYEKFGSSICMRLPQFQANTGCHTVSYFFSVSKRVVFELASSSVMPFNMLLELGALNILAELVKNGVKKFIQSYGYRGKEAEGVTTRITD